MHIHASYKVSMTGETTDLACPISAFGLVCMSTSGTPATCSSFGASEAQDVGLFGFVDEVVDVFAILPQGHTLIVVATLITIADTMRVANEETSHFLLNTEVNHLSRRLMAHITDSPFRTPTEFVLGVLQFLPTARILLAVGLFLGECPQAHASLPLETANATSCDNHRLASIGTDGCKMNFTQIDGGVNLTRSVFRLRYLDAHMQLKAVLPDQATGSGFFWQIDRQNEGLPPSAHWQYYTPAFTTHGLSRPHDRIEPLRFPRILYLGVGRLELPCRLDIGKESMHDHLNRLAVQGKFPLRGSLQLIATRPLRVFLTCCLVQFTAGIPDVGSFLLRRFEALEERMGGVQSIHTYCFHGMILAWKQVVCKWVKPDIPTTQLPIIWCGYPSTDARYLQGTCKRKPNA
jgi:hypothetical protein